jgi:hypothetical protein
MKLLAAFISGLIFAIGLVLGGMTQPAKVIGFLDFSGGAWDPSLALVMAGALTIYGLGFRLVTRRSSPLLEADFQIPERSDLPARLFVGAVFFGVGWAVSGFCPGPALVSVGSGMSEALVFVPAMMAGMILFSMWSPTAQGETSTENSEDIP